MSSVARIKVIKTKVILMYHTKGVSSQVSSNSDQEIKTYSYSNSSTKIGKNKKQEKIFWVTKRDNKRITNQDRLQGLQIGARGITNRDRFRNFKSGQKDYKSVQRFQIRVKRFQIGTKITNWGKRNFKSGQGLQIRAGITNRCKTTLIFLALIDPSLELFLS